MFILYYAISDSLKATPGYLVDPNDNFISNFWPLPPLATFTQCDFDLDSFLFILKVNKPEDFQAPSVSQDFQYFGEKLILIQDSVRVIRKLQF